MMQKHPSATAIVPKYVRQHDRTAVETPRPVKTQGGEGAPAARADSQADHSEPGCPPAADTGPW